MTKQTAMQDQFMKALMSNPAFLAALAKASPKAAPAVNADGKTERQLELEKLTVSAFKRKGLKADQIKPRVNILTFNRWVEKGFVVKEGEKAVKVKNLRLFHETQVRPLTDEDEAKFAARQQAQSQPAEQQAAA